MTMEDQHQQTALSWHQPGLLPPNLITITAVIVLDGHRETTNWALRREDGTDEVLEALEGGCEASLDHALIAIQDRLPSWVRRAREEIAPF